jgi:hypothetical protein
MFLSLTILRNCPLPFLNILLFNSSKVLIEKPFNFLNVGSPRHIFLIFTVNGFSPPSPISRSDAPYPEKTVLANLETQSRNPSDIPSPPTMTWMVYTIGQGITRFALFGGNVVEVP